MKENVAIYIRTNQKDVLEKEKKNLLEYCDKNFFKKKKLYIDTNCSGRKKNPKLNELIK